MEKIKILLINPHETLQGNFTVPPLGLLYIAATTAKAGYEVGFIDGCLKGYEAIIKKIEEFKPALVGITCLTPGRKNALKVAEEIKKVSPQTSVVLGGVHPTLMGEQILENYPTIDYLVRGAGERTFVELLDALFFQRQRLKEIEGIGFRDQEQIILTPLRKIHDFSTLPFPKWDLINFEEYHKYDGNKFDLIVNGVSIKDNVRVPIIFSRGCSGACTFCSTWKIWQGWHHRSIKEFVDEIEYLNKIKKINHFVICDDSFVVDLKEVDDFCEEILKRNLKIAFWASARADCVNWDILLKLKKAGCYGLSYGIETGSEKILKAINKKSDLQKSYTAIQLTKEAGLVVTALMMVGNMGETYQTINETVDFLKKTKPTLIGTAEGVMVFPGTAIYNYCKGKKVIDDRFWLGDKPYYLFTVENSRFQLKLYELALRLRRKLTPFTPINFFTHYLYYILKNKLNALKWHFNRIFSN